MKTPGATRKASALLLILMAAWLIPTAFAQTITASLAGTVRDPSGAVVPGAKVQVVNTATNATRSLETGPDGRFVAPSLPPGSYSVIVTAAGFKRAERAGIELRVNQAAEIEVIMEVGGVTETVEITAEPPLLDTASAGVGHVIGTQSIVNLPLNQRNPYALVFLVPGVVGNVGFYFNNVNIAINGGRPGANEILVDGIPSSPPLVNPILGYSVFPCVDAVQEFKVQTSSYSAEFGRTAGGIINLIYKSGTNALHGSLFEFLRNSKLDANNFFSNARGIPLSSFKRHQFGASAGGPLLIPGLYDGRNRTFFFVAYEGLRQGAATSLLTTVPTASERVGDFSKTRSAAGTPIAIYDPETTTRLGAGYVRQAFPGNVIPAFRIDPVARNVVKYYPLPNQPGDPISGALNFAASGTAPTNTDQLDIKADENLNDRNRFFVRYSHRKFAMLPTDLLPPESRVADPWPPESNEQIFNNAAFDYTLTSGPSFLMGFRYGFGRTLVNLVPRGFGFDPTQLGFPAYIRDNADVLMFPRFSPADYYTIGHQAYRHNAFETHSSMVSATKVRTGHVLKAGFEGRLIRVNNTEAGNADGSYSFPRSFTQGPDPNRATATAGNGMASFLLGLGSGTLTKNFKGVATQSSYWAWYFADDWKVGASLTLNLGVRYELELPRTERYNRMNVFNPSVPHPLASRVGLPDLRGGLEFVGVEGRSRRQFESDRNNWSPRMGFAYQATKATVLRGGFGVFYNPSLYAAGGTVGNFGYRSDTTFFGTLDGVTPYRYLRDPFPDGLVPIPGNKEGLMTAVGSSIQAPLRGDNVVPYTLNWSFNIQRQLPGSMMVEVGYVGNHGLHLVESGEGNYNLNQLRPEQLSLGTQLQEQVPNPFFGFITTGALAAKTVPRRFLLRQFPHFTTVNPLWKTGASSIYHSFQLKTEKRFSAGLSLMVAYTAGKLIDDRSIIAVVGENADSQNIYDRKGERSVSANDVSQRFVLSYVYEVPLGRGHRIGGQWNRILQGLLGGWQANGILTLQTGFPLALSAQNTSNADNQVQRPNNSGKSARLSGPVSQRLNRYFDTSVFSQPAPFTFGNVGRTLPDVRRPGLRGLDASVFKNFRLAERLSLQFRAEAFNLTNTPQFGTPNQSLASVTFGVISSQANSPRQLQFGLKLLF